MTTEEIASHLSGRGVKPTAMRILVFKTLMDCVRPVSLREIDDKMVTAERSTIFRTLTLLLQQGLIHAIEDGSGAVRYEVCHGHDHCSLADQHAHFYCTVCQRTFCLHDVGIPHPVVPDGFHVTQVNYLLKGVCPACCESM
ncbi:MAG: Fur family transcriptional regulator [Bacteroidaceae bacterium]